MSAVEVEKMSENGGKTLRTSDCMWDFMMDNYSVCVRVCLCFSVYMCPLFHFWFKMYTKKTETTLCVCMCVCMLNFNLAKVFKSKLFSFLRHSKVQVQLLFMVSKVLWKNPKCNHSNKYITVSKTRSQNPGGFSALFCHYILKQWPWTNSEEKLLLIIWMNLNEQKIYLHYVSLMTEGQLSSNTVTPELVEMQLWEKPDQSESDWDRGRSLLPSSSISSVKYSQSFQNYFNAHIIC